MAAMVMRIFVPIKQNIQHVTGRNLLIPGPVPQLYRCHRASDGQFILFTVMEPESIARKNP